VKVLITGITGMIGSALGARLRAAGHEVVGVSRTPAPGTITWDLDAGSIEAGALDSVDAVVHLAGEPIDGRWTAKKRRRIVDSRIRSTALLADALAAADAPPKVFVSGSAIGFYGDRPGETVDETSPRGNGFLADLCVSWEAAAVPASRAGIRVVHPRTGIVLDASGGALKPVLLATKFFVGGPLGSGDQMWSWITLDDEVSALMHLLHADVEGHVNLTAPCAVSQRQFAQELGRQLGRPARMPAPRFALRALLGEMADGLIFASCDAKPNVLAASGFRFAQPALRDGLASVLANRAH
jgi:uncharacterized protein (TIGR01777 family)